jgi:hypothetical protein
MPAAPSSKSADIDRDRLAKVLGLLGSPESGEALAAACQASALFEDVSMACAWAQLFRRRHVIVAKRPLSACCQTWL